MQLEDFDYVLPESLIAQYPLPKRSASRLLGLDKRDGSRQHRCFSSLLDLICPGDLLVFNNTRVIPARICAKKITGGKVDVLVERILNEKKFVAHLRANKPLLRGTELILAGDDTWAKIIGREDDLFVLELHSNCDIFAVLEKFGHVPLPPYISRKDEVLDGERYQTIFAKEKGAVAAPTAGLHFDDELMDEIKTRGIDIAYVTLHVGAGTFQPVRTEEISEHKMHKERFTVPRETWEKIIAAKKRGGNIVAVGTTVVRSLETVAKNFTVPFKNIIANSASENQEGIFSGETDIFIYPGYQFQCVDKLLTNFHLPKSTLLMLVAAFAGYDYIMNAYREAVLERYRFFSYGDAMFIF